MFVLGGTAFPASSYISMENKTQTINPIVTEQLPVPAPSDLGTSWVTSLIGIVGSGISVVVFSFALRTIGLLVVPESVGGLSYLG